MIRSNPAGSALLLHPSDSVVVMKSAVKAGEPVVIRSGTLTAAKSVPAGHKMAAVEIPDGAPIRKYGQIIGFARGRIAPGEHVHTHQLAMKDFGPDYEF